MEIKSITEMLKDCNGSESELDRIFELPFYGKEGYDEQVSELKDIVNEYNSRLVPGSGPAKTVAGELIRAICRIYYRWLNDGDVIIPVINGGCSEYVNPSYCYIYAVLHDYARSTRDENYNESPIERFIEGELERFSIGTCENDFKNHDSHKEYTWHIHCLAKAILVCIKEFDLENVENKYDSRSFDENGDTGYFGYYSVEGSLYDMKRDKKKFEEIFGEGDEVAQHNFDAPNECLGLELNLQFLNGYRFKGEWSYNNCNGTCYLEGCMECKTNDWKGGIKKDYEQILLEFSNYNKYKDEDLFKYFKSLMDFINEHEDDAFEVYYDHPYNSSLCNKLSEDDLKLYKSKFDNNENWIEFKTIELTQYILIKFDEVVFVLDKYKEAEIIAAREKKEEKKDE